MGKTGSRTDYFVRLEDQYGARNYMPLDVVITRGRGHLGLRCGRAQVSGLPLGLFGCQSGALSSQDQEGDARPAGKLTITSRAFRNDQLPLFFIKKFAR